MGISKDKTRSKLYCGVAWFLASLFVCSTLDALQKYVGERLHSFQITFLRFAFSTLILLPLVFLNLRKNKNAPKWSPYWKIHFVRGAILALALASWCYGLTLVKISTATTLNFSIPFFTLILSIPILKEKIDVFRWFATIIGFVGVVIVLNPAKIDFNPQTVCLIASSALFALMDVLNKKYVSKDSMLNILAYTAFFTMLLSASPALNNWVSPSAKELALLFVIGCGANLILFCLIKALQNMEASALAPFRYLELIISAVIGFLVFKEIPSIATCLGAIVIVPSSCVLIYFENKKSNSSEEDKVVACEEQ